MKSIFLEAKVPSVFFFSEHAMPSSVLGWPLVPPCWVPEALITASWDTTSPLRCSPSAHTTTAAKDEHLVRARHFTCHDSELSTIITEVKKLRPTEIKQFPPGHPARKLQSLRLDPGSLAWKLPASHFRLIQRGHRNPLRAWKHGLLGPPPELPIQLVWDRVWEFAF